MSEQVSNTEQKASDAVIPDLQEKVLQTIKTVYDPEIPVDVYELGLIYEIRNHRRHHRERLADSAADTEPAITG